MIPRFATLSVVLFLVGAQELSDSRTIIAISSRDPQLSELGISSAAAFNFVDVRSVPERVAAALATAGLTRRLSESHSKVEECFRTKEAIETMSTLGFQVVNTGSEHCHATTEEVSDYLEVASSDLNYEFLCEPNIVMSLAAPRVHSIDSAAASSVSVRSVVNDEFAYRQANLDIVELAEAWKKVSDANRSPREVVVAVVDTGLDIMQEDISNQVFSNAQCEHGFDFVAKDAKTVDENGHGTHVSGILGAQTNNEVGIAGIANVKIMSLRILGADGKGNLLLAVNALDFAVAAGADISSHSYGGDVGSPLLKKAFERATSVGHLVIVAAGNDGKDITTEGVYPCSYTQDVAGMMCVAASGGESNPGDLAWFSNYAAYVDIAAPGVKIPSTYWTADNQKNLYAFLDGTSQATPHVTGVAALLVGMGLSANDTKAVLVASAASMNTDLFGRLNAKDAVTMAMTKPTVAPRPARHNPDPACSPSQSLAFSAGLSALLMILVSVNFVLSN